MAFPVRVAPCCLTPRAVNTARVRTGRRRQVPALREFATIGCKLLAHLTRHSGLAQLQPARLLLERKIKMRKTAHVLHIAPKVPEIWIAVDSDGADAIVLAEPALLRNSGSSLHGDRPCAAAAPSRPGNPPKSPLVPCRVSGRREPFSRRSSICRAESVRSQCFARVPPPRPSQLTPGLARNAQE